jgi:hypothetical protein
MTLNSPAWLARLDTSSRPAWCRTSDVHETGLIPPASKAPPPRAGSLGAAALLAVLAMRKRLRTSGRGGRTIEPQSAAL